MTATESMKPEEKVVNNPEKHQFEIKLGQELGLLTYREHGAQIVLLHTEVPESHRGKGFADKLAKAALEYAKQNNLAVVPSCRFVRAYLKRHPDAL